MDAKASKTGKALSSLMTRRGPMYGICSRATKFVALPVTGLDTIVVNLSPFPLA